MPIYRAQISFGADSALPRDRFVITPHFRTNAIIGTLQGTDEAGLTRDLADGLVAWQAAVGIGPREITVKMYDAQGAPPHYPLATSVRQANAFPASRMPRELALCLSFFSGRNVPRRRGRLYLPLTMLSTADVSGARPSATHFDSLAALVPLFTGLGGVDVDWVVYSRRDAGAFPVTNWFIDDEFDVQRRRGLRASGRRTGTTDEAGAVVTP